MRAVTCAHRVGYPTCPIAPQAFRACLSPAHTYQRLTGHDSAENGHCSPPAVVHRSRHKIPAPCEGTPHQTKVGTSAATARKPNPSPWNEVDQRYLLTRLQ